ncbi:MAG: type II toxin-antitoxin system RelE/ParE family toxin [Candidatus Thiosymbion ectosymbiont of Robbea hypermnestra]|nr:type II toxin-antitoxin system RelE/ParE family toxin [Candidatus Thiosymbion ectosymbiont of Robbea hypermnestra]
MIYRLSARAEADLMDIWIYSAEQWGIDQADRYIEALRHRFSWLSENRGLWKVRPDIAEGIYSYPNQSHIIYFRTLDSGQVGLEILRVLHGRMDHSGRL